MPTRVDKRRFTADEYQAMGRAGFFLDTDRDVKASLYARHGIIEYWLADIQGGR